MNRFAERAFTTLDRLTPEEALRAGAKAANCARLKQAGFRVPDGMVVLSNATETDLAGLASHPWYDQLPMDVTFAVRSSGIGEDSDGESFAGIHRTLLNVTRRELQTAVTDCRASARSAEALGYREKRGLSVDTIQMGVLIQQMVHPVAAGVAFTINPVTGSNDEIVINSSWGVGEALVSGQVDPDEYIVDKGDGVLVWSRLGEKGNGSSDAASLTPEQIRELADVLTQIERHYGTAQDVEWCHDGDQLWIVQSRPITTSKADVHETEWTRANLAEVLPDMASPQVRFSFEELTNRAERQFLGRLLAPDDELGPIVKTFYGRLHFNLSQLRRVCEVSVTAPASMLQSIGHGDAIQDSDRVVPKPSWRTLRALPDVLRMLWRHQRVASIVRQHDAQVAQYMRDLTGVNPRQLDDREIWALVERWMRDSPDSLQTVLLLSNVLFHEAPVRAICDSLGLSFEQLVYPQLALGERTVSAQQAFDLVALAEVARRDQSTTAYLLEQAPTLTELRRDLQGTEFMHEFERFLAKYGHRGRYEYDWSLPRYKEDPTSLLLALRAHLKDEKGADEAAIVRRQEKEAAVAWAVFELRLSPKQKRTIVPRVRKAIGRIKQYYVWREHVRSDIAQVGSEMRMWHLALAERFVSRQWIDRADDYFMLDLREVGAVINGDRSPETLRGIVAVRRAEQERYRPLQMPLVMRASELPRLLRTAGVTGGVTDHGALIGMPVSGGCAEAEVVVVRDPGDFSRMKRGAILVAPATDPSWTPLFSLASGVIVEVGGVLSHASTIAREYGLPALANVKHATKRLRTGERVRLDANEGVIYRLSEEHSSEVALLTEPQQGALA